MVTFLSLTPSYITLKEQNTWWFSYFWNLCNVRDLKMVHFWLIYIHRLLEVPVFVFLKLHQQFHSICVVKLSWFTSNMDQRASGDMEAHRGCGSFERWYLLLLDLAWRQGFSSRFCYKIVFSLLYTKNKKRNINVFGSSLLNSYFLQFFRQAKWRNSYLLYRQAIDV